MPGVSRPRPNRAASSAPLAAGRPITRQAGRAVEPLAHLFALGRVAAELHEPHQRHHHDHDRPEREQPA
jgi:Ser/Thr protein kinase RdoA (MazF antagonist)